MKFIKKIKQLLKANKKQNITPKLLAWDIETLDINEQSKILYSNTNSEIYKTFIIPTAEFSKVIAQEKIATLISDYKKEILFNQEIEEIHIDGSKKNYHLRNNIG